MRTGKSTPGARCLSDGERTVVEEIPLEVDCSRIRLYEAGCSGTTRVLRRLVLWLSRNRAAALGNHIFLPDRCEGNLAILAHELTHCGQYQRWGAVVYFARGMAAQLRHLLHRRLGLGSDPYDYQVKPGKPFDAYGMEQQAQMVEDRWRGMCDHPIPSA